MTHQVAVQTRGKRRQAAAEYIGVSTTKFDDMVADGRMPKPIAVDGCRIWDVRKIEEAFDALSEPRNSWDR